MSDFAGVASVDGLAAVFDFFRGRVFDLASENVSAREDAARRVCNETKVRSGFISFKTGI